MDNVIGIPPNIAIPSDSSTTLQTSKLWDYVPNGSQWIQSNAVIHVPPEINTYFITTLPNFKEYVPITMSPSTNGIYRLVKMNERVVRTKSTYHELLRTCSYIQQRHMFHPSIVCVLQFITIYLSSIYEQYIFQEESAVVVLMVYF